MISSSVDDLLCFLQLVFWDVSMYWRVLRSAQRQISFKSLRIASDNVCTLENFRLNI